MGEIKMKRKVRRKEKSRQIESHVDPSTMKGRAEWEPHQDNISQQEP
jgi:hypothetical protein